MDQARGVGAGYSMDQAGGAGAGLSMGGARGTGAGYTTDQAGGAGAAYPMGRAGGTGDGYTGERVGATGVGDELNAQGPRLPGEDPTPTVATQVSAAGATLVLSGQPVAAGSNQLVDAVPSQDKHRHGPDGYIWRKTSHKRLTVLPVRRLYYRCVEEETAGCPAEKIVDRQLGRHQGDTSMDVVSFKGEHNHVPTAAARRARQQEQDVMQRRQHHLGGPGPGSPTPTAIRQAKQPEADETQPGQPHVWPCTSLPTPTSPRALPGHNHNIPNNRPLPGPGLGQGATDQTHLHVRSISQQRPARSAVLLSPCPSAPGPVSDHSAWPVQSRIISVPVPGPGPSILQPAQTHSGASWSWMPPTSPAIENGQFHRAAVQSHHSSGAGPGLGQGAMQPAHVGSGAGRSQTLLASQPTEAGHILGADRRFCPSRPAPVQAQGEAQPAVSHRILQQASQASPYPYLSEERTCDVEKKSLSSHPGPTLVSVSADGLPSASPSATRDSLTGLRAQPLQQRRQLKARDPEQDQHTVTPQPAVSHVDHSERICPRAALTKMQLMDNALLLGLLGSAATAQGETMSTKARQVNVSAADSAFNTAQGSLGATHGASMTEGFRGAIREEFRTEGLQAFSRGDSMAEGSRGFVHQVSRNNQAKKKPRTEVSGDYASFHDMAMAAPRNFSPHNFPVSGGLTAHAHLTHSGTIGSEASGPYNDFATTDLGIGAAVHDANFHLVSVDTEGLYSFQESEGRRVGEGAGHNEHVGGRVKENPLEVLLGWDEDLHSDVFSTLGLPETGQVEAELPEAQVAETQLPETELPETEVPGAELPEAEVPGTELRQMELP